MGGNKCRRSAGQSTSRGALDGDGHGWAREGWDVFLGKSKFWRDTYIYIYIFMNRYIYINMIDKSCSCKNYVYIYIYIELFLVIVNTSDSPL